MSGNEDEINISIEEFRQAQKEPGESQDIGDADGKAEGNTDTSGSDPDTDADSGGAALQGSGGGSVTEAEATSGSSGGGSAGGSDSGTTTDTGSSPSGSDGSAAASTESTTSTPTDADSGPALQGSSGESVTEQEATPSSDAMESDRVNADDGPGPTDDPDGNGLTRAEEQDVNAALEEDVDRLDEQRQGVEQGTDRVGQRASDLEQQVLDANPGLDADDVRIVRDGDVIRAELTAAGREQAGLTPSNRDLRQQVASGREDIQPSDVVIERGDGGGVEASLTDEARRERLRERAAAEFGVPESAIVVERENGQLVSSVDQSQLNEQGSVGPIERAPDGPVGSGEELVTDQDQELVGDGATEARGSDTAAERRSTDIEDATRGETASNVVGVERARGRAERALEEQLGVQLSDADIAFSQRRGRVQARLSDQGERTVARERAPFQNTPVEGLFEAGAEARVRFEQATDPVANRFDEVTPDEDVLTRRVPDASQLVTGGGLATAAAAGVVAPEPVSTGTGALILGGLAAGGAVTAAARRTDAFDGDGVPDESVTSSEIPVPENGEPVRDGELTPPANGEPVRDSELDVPQDRRTVAPEEIGVPREAIRNGDAQITGPDGVDVTNNGEIVVPREATVVARRTRGEEEEEEEDEEDSQSQSEDEVIVEVPEEMIPEEEVTLGEEPVDESTEESNADNSEESEEETEPVVRERERVTPDVPTEEQTGQGVGQQDRQVAGEMVQEPTAEPREPVDERADTVKAAADPRPATPAALLREVQEERLAAEADALVQGEALVPGQLVGERAATLPATDLFAQQAVGSAFQRPTVQSGQAFASEGVFAEPTETVVEEVAVESPVAGVGTAPGQTASRRSRREEEPLGRPVPRSGGEPDDVVGIDRAPRAGFFAETATALSLGGLTERQAPSEQTLERLNTPARTDLPTEAILEGQVDVGEVRDFFAADGRGY